MIKQSTISKLCLVVVATIGAPNVVQAQSTWGRTIGSMCFERMPDDARAVTSRTNQDGQLVEEFDVDFEALNSGAKPKLRLFRSPPTSPFPLARCSELVGDVLIEGDVKKLRINDARETAPSGDASATITIEGGKFNATLTNTKSGLMPLWGGELQLGRDASIAPSDLAWLTNPSRMTSNSGEQSDGEVDVVTWGRKLTGVKLVLPGSSEATSITMDAGNTNVTIRVPLSGKSTEMMQGTFVAEGTDLEADAFSLAGVSLSEFRGVAEQVKILAGDDGVRLSLNDLKYLSGPANVSASSTEGTSTESSGVFQEIHAQVGRSGNALNFDLFDSLRMVGTGANCGLIHEGLKWIETSSCRLSVAQQNGGVGKFGFEAERADAFIIAAFEEPQNLRFSVDGSADETRFSGSLGLAKLKTGAFGFDVADVELSNSILAAQSLKIPFLIDNPSIEGETEVRLPDGLLALSGELSRFRMKGFVELNLSDINDWRIHVGASDLAFGASIEASYDSSIFGTRPEFGALDLQFKSDTPLNVKALSSEGKIGVDAGIMLLANPTIDLGSAALPFKLAGSLDFYSGVKLQYDIASGKPKIVNAIANLSNVQLQTTGSSWSSIGDIDIMDGAIGLEDFQIKFESGKGNLTLANLSVSAQQVRSTRTTDEASQSRWSGKFADGFTIANFEGTLKQASEENPWQLTEPVLRNVNLALSDVKVGSDNSYRFTSDSFRLNLAEVSEKKLVGSLELTGGRISTRTNVAKGGIDIRSFLLNFEGGDSKVPLGSGRLITRGLRINQNTFLEDFGMGCYQQRPSEGLPVKIDFQSPAMQMDLELTKDGLEGAGEAVMTVASLVSTGEYDCRATAINQTIVEEQRVRYRYPCGTWSKPFRTCKGWTVLVPEVKVEVDRRVKVRQLLIGAAFKNLELELDGDGDWTYCGKDGVAVPLADISFYFTPRTNIALADNIIDELSNQTYGRVFGQTLAGITAIYGALAPNLPVLGEATNTPYFEGLCS